MAGTIADTPGYYDDFTSGKNTGYVERAKLFEFSNTNTYYSQLLFEFSQIEKLIFPNNAVSITFSHDSDERRLCSDTETAQYSLQIEDISLHVTKFWLTPETVDACYTQLNKIGYQMFHFKRISTTGPYSVAKDSSEISVVVGANIKMPLVAICCFVETDSFTGNFTKNAFKYSTLPIRYSIAKFGSVVAPHQSGYNPIYSVAQTHPELAYEYSCFLQSITGSHMPNRGALTYDEWLNGQHYYSYMFTANSINNSFVDHEYESKDNLTMHFQFSKPLEKSYFMLIHVITQSYAKYNDNHTWTLQYIPGVV